MRKMSLVFLSILIAFSGVNAQNSSDFVPLFNGKNLDGWTGNTGRVSR